MSYKYHPLSTEPGISLREPLRPADMETERFCRYEENFMNSSRIISRSLNQLERSNGVVDQIVTASVEIEGELAEAEGYLRAMDIEFRTMSSSEKLSYEKKLRGYQDEWRQLQQTYATSKLSAEAQASRTGGGGSSSRAKLLNANAKLDQSTATLQESKQIVERTKGIGDTVLSDLERQKEHLQDAQRNVKETKDFTSEARRVLRMMGNRAIIHKICVMFTIVALAAAIVATGYYGVMKK